MEANRIADLLACLNSSVDEKSHRAGWVVATCCFAPWTHEGGVDHKPHFGVNLPYPGKTQIYNCFVCGEAGALDDLVFDVREYNRKKKDVRYQIGKALEVLVADADEIMDIDVPDYDEPVIDPEEVIPWPEFFLESFKSVFMFKDATDYLLTRQIDTGAAKELDLRFDTSRQRVCFPIRDLDGRLVGLHGRAINEHPLPYFAYGYQDRRNKMPWLGESWVDFDKPVVLVESVFDLASVYRVYKNVMCPLSSGFSNAKAKRIDCALQFVTLFDHGTGGDNARERLTKVITSPMKHLIPDACFGDPGNMGVVELREVLHNYIEL